MKIYDLQPEGRENSKWVLFHTQNQISMPDNFNECTAFFDKHRVIPIDRNADFTPRTSKAKFADYSNLSHDVHPVFSERAKRVLEPHLAGLGRWIQLDSDEAPYWLFFITNVVDALDEAKSDVRRFADGKRVMRIASYAFKPEVIRDQFLFTLPQQPGSDRLVTDRFIDLVHEHGLTGFWFQRLWSSERGPEPSGVKDWLKPRFTGLEPKSARVVEAAP
jgi:hypothetical protein